MSHLQQFRAEIDEFMKTNPDSPLYWDLPEGFAGLNYYAEDKNFVFTVTVERFPETEPVVQMETSTGTLRPYRRWGRFKFTIDGQEAALTIYASLQGHDFFMPFRDATSGKETYGSGRYLDSYRPGLQRTGENQFEVDFNLAYNPYCAYNDDYSCPLPPRENWLTVAISAGEKRFK